MNTSSQQYLHTNESHKLHHIKLYTTQIFMMMIIFLMFITKVTFNMYIMLKDFINILKTSTNRKSNQISSWLHKFPAQPYDNGTNQMKAIFLCPITSNFCCIYFEFFKLNHYGDLTLLSHSILDMWYSSALW